MEVATTPTNDAEIRRQKRNLTEAQKKNIEATKEGVVVNAYVKNPLMQDVYDSMVISSNTKMPEKLYEKKNTEEKSILPISLIATGVMASVALLSALVRHSAKVNLTVKPEEKLPTLSRNLAVNEETHQAIYQMVQCPNQKTILAGVGVLGISAMGFMGKMFIDGFKEIWVKKQEAKIQKNLQENLIAVETQSFAGKIQIIRSMLSEKAKEFSDYLDTRPKMPPAFERMRQGLNFGANNTEETSKKDNIKYFALGALTLGGIIGLGFLTLKNLTSGKKYLEKYIGDTKTKISEIVAGSDSKSKDTDKINLKNMLQAIDADSNFIRDQLSKLNWEEAEKNDFINQTVFDIRKSTTMAEKALGGDGTPKPTFYSHVNDYRAFFYNYLIDSSNPLFRNLFFGITGVTAASYVGKAMGEGVKEVEVKKYNAETELELQKRLVATELRNFKAKKDAAINPLCEEFYLQLNKDKPKEELKIIAENILFEVKNGPPYVYS